MTTDIAGDPAAALPTLDDRAPSGDAAPVDRPNRELRRAVELVLALAPTVLLVGYWLTADRVGRITLLEDDAYYYFGVARSIAAGEGSTFAGSIMTNGYHPLWLLVLVPVTWVVGDPEPLVLAVVLVHGVLWALSVREAFKIGDAIAYWHVSAAAVASYSLLAVMTGHLAFNGMESALVMFLFLVVIRRAVTSADGGLRNDLITGALLALICLSRLDAVFGAAAVALVILFTGRSGTGDLVRRGVALAAPPAFALSGYLLLNLALFGTATPVSGQAKALGSTSNNYDHIGAVFQTGRFDGRPLWLGAAGVALVLGALLTRPWRASPARTRLVCLVLALVVGQAVLTTYMVTSTSFTRAFTWYHFHVALFTFGATVLIGAWAVERFGRLARGAGVVLAGLLVVGAATEIVQRSREPKRDAAVIAADWVDENVPDDAVLAMGDRAGYFGYLADRPLLHLEGLVADVDFLHQLERGEALERMDDEGVDYYVHNAREGRAVTIDGERCHRFVEPPYTLGPTFEVTVCDRDEVQVVHDSGGGKVLTIWRYRPELNSG